MNLECCRKQLRSLRNNSYFQSNVGDNLQQVTCFYTVKVFLEFSTTTIDSDSTQDEDLNDEISSLKLSENLKTAVLDLLGHKKEVAKMKHDDKKYKIIDKYLSV